jgi:hypothetical protein
MHLMIAMISDIIYYDDIMTMIDIMKSVLLFVLILTRDNRTQWAEKGVLILILLSSF